MEDEKIEIPIVAAEIPNEAPKYISGAERLEQIANDVRAGKPVEPVSVRTLLAWFGYSRRGSWGVVYINDRLTRAGLSTEPDFRNVWLDATIRFVLLQGSEQPAPAQADSGQTEAQSTNFDPTQRLLRLKAATNAPIRVSPQQTVKEALTIMMEYDYSQLPVMSGDRSVKGAITLSSIAKRLALGAKCDLVQECIEQAHVVSGDMPLFDAINDIVNHTYVLVKGPDDRITGIVTTSDLSLEFRQLAEPFLLLGEIEQHVRALIERGKFTPEELREFSSEQDANDVSQVSDLTFGAYVRLLQNEDRWSRLNINLDRVEFVKTLDHIREIRNDVMHFDPDPLPEEDLRLLRNWVTFLQRLRRILY